MVMKLWWNLNVVKLNEALTQPYCIYFRDAGVANIFTIMIPTTVVFTQGRV